MLFRSDHEQDPADGGDDGRDGEQLADEDEDDTYNDHWVVLSLGLGSAVPYRRVLHTRLWPWVSLSAK